ncbi:MAG: ABC transporter ATP-binding protein [Deltaproteobacteria bacterium]|nr:ABC transporter ATP-binding protein [Deltaproteobacteria bacterium]MBW2306197.1 ABC transporter ATP-binding protein [Deltaproteobacteria bacterium]
MEPLLETVRVTRAFGGLIAVAGVSFRTYAGQIKAIIGPNGAGKTTLFNVINGFIKPTTGDVRLRGRSLRDLAVHQVARLGISRTFQNVQNFGNMTVLENVMVGRHLMTRTGFLGAGLRLQRMRKEEKHTQRKAYEVLARVGLDHRSSELAENLSFGEQRLLELARAMATEPELILLDEPVSGLNESEKTAMVDILSQLRQQGINLLMVDHDMDLIMNISDEVVVLDRGQKIAEDTPRGVQNNEEVIRAYLGEGIRNA